MQCDAKLFPMEGNQNTFTVYCLLTISHFLPYSLLVVRLSHLARHHVTKLGELNLPGTVSVELVDHLQQLCLGGIHAHGSHGVAQLTGRYRPTTVSIKHVECLSETDSLKPVPTPQWSILGSEITQ